MSVVSTGRQQEEALESTSTRKSLSAIGRVIIRIVPEKYAHDYFALLETRSLRVHTEDLWGSRALALYRDLTPETSFRTNVLN